MPSRSVSWPLRISIVREPGGPLIDRGFGLIYDVDRNITWLQDANYARTGGRSRDGQMTWDDAMSWVASLDIFGVKGWRLPTALNRDGSAPAPAGAAGTASSAISCMARGRQGRGR